MLEPAGPAAAADWSTSWRVLYGASPNLVIVASTRVLPVPSEQLRLTGCDKWPCSTRAAQESFCETP